MVIIFYLWDAPVQSVLEWVWMRVWLCLNIHIIFRLQEEMLQREDAENNLRSFRQVYICMCSEKKTTTFFRHIIGPDVWLSATKASITLIPVSVWKTLLIVTSLLAIKGSVQAWSSCPLASDLDTQLKRQLCLRAGLGVHDKANCCTSGRGQC